MKTTPTERDAQFYRTRQLATFLPIVGIPFLAVMFWVFGGGAGTSAAAAPVPVGINTELPGAAERSITSSKLEAYAAPVDSLRNRELTAPGRLDTVAGRNMTFNLKPDGQPGTRADQTAAIARQQLAAVQAAQRGSGAAVGSSPALTPEQQMQLMQAQHERELADARTQLQIAQLSTATTTVGSGGGGGAVAPPAVAVATPKRKPTTRALMVDEDAIVSRLGSNGTGKKRTTSFQGLDDGSTSGMAANTLAAVIHESQEVVSGSLVKMRLTDAAVVNGHRLAANTFIYGKCALAGERLTITIETLKSGNNIFPAALEVYDMDGLEGLHIPGAITRDASKQAGADALGAADLMTMSGDPATAAAGVAVNAVKILGQKKIRLVKVQLKAGYNLLLRVEKE